MRIFRYIKPIVYAAFAIGGILGFIVFVIMLQEVISK